MSTFEAYEVGFLQVTKGINTRISELGTYTSDYGEPASRPSPPHAASHCDARKRRRVCRGRHRRHPQAGPGNQGSKAKRTHCAAFRRLRAPPV